MSLRRFYHRSVKHHHRFNLAVILTIIAIAWIVVPAVVNFVETVSQYNPSVYEPKDTQREQWLGRSQVLSGGVVTLENVLKLALCLFAGLAWLMLAPTLQRSRRSGRR
jgi:hypothetical protein